MWIRTSVQQQTRRVCLKVLDSTGGGNCFFSMGSFYFHPLKMLPHLLCKIEAKDVLMVLIASVVQVVWYTILGQLLIFNYLFLPL